MNSKITVSVILCVLLQICCTTTANSAENKVIDLINKLDQEQSLYLFGGLTVEKSATDEIPRGAESITERMYRYFNTHSLTLKDVDQKSEARSSKLKKILLPTLLALKLKMALVLPVVLMILKFLSVKALLLGTTALLFSGATLMKDLMAKKQERITTAYISANPSPAVSAEIVTDWNRNGQEYQQAHDIAYNAYNVQ